MDLCLAERDVLRRYVTSLLGRDSHAAEDVVQETLLRAWQLADRLDFQQRPVRMWLFRVARNLVVDLHRRDGRTIAVGLGPSDYADALTEPDPADQVTERCLLLDALRTLSAGSTRSRCPRAPVRSSRRRGRGRARRTGGYGQIPYPQRSSADPACAGPAWMSRGGGMSIFGSGLKGWLGYAGLVLLFIVLVNLLVRRTGGWKLLFHRIRRELSGAAHAFYDPVAAKIRYRKRVAFLAGLLRSQKTWADAEQAIGYAAALPGEAEPYGVVVARERIGVLVAGSNQDGPLPLPWRRDEHDPRLWWIDASALADYPLTTEKSTAPLLVCGIDNTGRTAVLLNLLSGPATVSVYGEPRAARSVVQALAAQLDVRLPPGAVEVADGIHKGHAGMTAAEAIKRPDVWFVVGAEQLDAPLPFDHAAGQPGCRPGQLATARSAA